MLFAIFKNSVEHGRCYCSAGNPRLASFLLPFYSWEMKKTKILDLLTNALVCLSVVQELNPAASGGTIWSQENNRNNTKMKSGEDVRFFGKIRLRHYPPKRPRFSQSIGCHFPVYFGVRLLKKGEGD